MTDETVRLRSSGLEWVDTGDEIIALDADRSVYMSGNEALRELWPLLNDGATLSELVSALIDRYSVDAKTATDDVKALMESLQGRGLLQCA